MPRPTPPPAGPGPAFPPGRLVRLASDAAGGGVLVEPTPGTARPPRFDPFPLPRLPASTVRWCAAAAGRFRDRRGACLAVVLLLDRLTRRWSPLIPSQTCSRRGVTWRSAAADYDHLPPHVLVAGSFQARGPGDVFDAAAAVPSFGGVHLVELHRGHRRRAGSFLFVRRNAGREPELADPAAVLVDDVDQALREAADRLRVG